MCCGRPPDTGRWCRCWGAAAGAGESEAAKLGRRHHFSPPQRSARGLHHNHVTCASSDAQVGCDFCVHPFQLLSEPIRRRIIEILASGEHTAGEISDSIVNEFAVTPSAVSRHLRILRENEAVIVRAEWVNRLYRLDPELLERLRDELHHLEQLWARRFGVMARDNDALSLPVVLPRRPRGAEGERKGLRGAMHRNDPWRRA